MSDSSFIFLPISGTRVKQIQFEVSKSVRMFFQLIRLYGFENE